MCFSSHCVAEDAMKNAPLTHSQLEVCEPSRSWRTRKACHTFFSLVQVLEENQGAPKCFSLQHEALCFLYTCHRRTGLPKAAHHRLLSSTSGFHGLALAWHVHEVICSDVSTEHFIVRDLRYLECCLVANDRQTLKAGFQEGTEGPGSTSAESDCHRTGFIKGAWSFCVGNLRVGVPRPGQASLFKSCPTLSRVLPLLS